MAVGKAVDGGRGGDTVAIGVVCTAPLQRCEHARAIASCSITILLELLLLLVGAVRNGHRQRVAKHLRYLRNGDAATLYSMMAAALPTGSLISTILAFQS